MKMRVLAISGVLLLLSTLCMAQYAATGVSVEVKFSFLAGEKLLPPGTYRFAESEQEGELEVTNVKTQEDVQVEIFTRIAPQLEPEVVFDKVGDQHHLSEVYIPGMDGFLLETVHAKHKHVRAKGAK